jgi:SOS response regulatory protein OraA/RecX
VTGSGPDEAVEQALRALRSRDRSAAELDARLAERGVSLEDRGEALERLERAGYVDDRRVAEARAAALAGRGSGDALIRDDLGRRGIGDDLAEAAIAALEPELVRAERVLARRGGGPKTVRYLASRGFGEDTLEVIARETEGAVG